MAVMIARGEETLTVPLWVSDLESFRRWTHSDEYPEQAKALYFDGNIYLDQPMEKLLHVEIKAAIATEIRLWARKHLPGYVFIDKMRFEHSEADLSSEPDVMYTSDESIEAGRVRLEDGDDTLEIEGSPDLVVEVISPSSLNKDDKILRRKYWEAGVKEYWLADSRKEPALTILKRNGRKYTNVAADGQGWMKSNVLKAHCRLVAKPGPAGTTKVTLEVKPLLSAR